MRYTPALLLLALTSVSNVHAKCKGGHKWRHPAATNSLEPACAHLAGHYGPHETDNKQIDPKNGDCYHFAVQRTSNQGGRLTFKQCKDYMLNEINGCERGGQTNHGNWEVV